MSRFFTIFLNDPNICVDDRVILSDTTVPIHYWNTIRAYNNSIMSRRVKMVGKNHNFFFFKTVTMYFRDFIWPFHIYIILEVLWKTFLYLQTKLRYHMNWKLCTNVKMIRNSHWNVTFHFINMVEKIDIVIREGKINRFCTCEACTEIGWATMITVAFIWKINWYCHWGKRKKKIIIIREREKIDIISRGEENWHCRRWRVTACSA